MTARKDDLGVVGGNDTADDGGSIFKDCPGREIVNHLTGRWGALILLALVESDVRFHALRDRIEGISEKMLSQTLRMLVRDGLVSRSVKPTALPEVSYGLTEMGRAAARPLDALVSFLRERVSDVLAAQQRYDAAR